MNMMPNNLSALRYKHLVILAIGFFVSMVTASTLFIQNAAAEPKVVDQVQTYCNKVVPKKAVKACAGTNNINIIHARNAATFHCIKQPTNGTQSDGNLKAECIVRQANILIKVAVANMEAAAAKKPISVKAFEASLKKVLAADIKITGGSIDNFSPDAGAAVTSSSGPIHQSPIQASGLPKPPTDTRTIQTVMGIFFGIIGAFAFLMITISGLKYITAGGDVQQASEAKKGIIYALVGLAIAVTAESIVVFLVNKVG